MATLQCTRCTAERKGFRRELDSWRHKLIHCVGFESILEGIYGPLLRDLNLFDDCEPEEVDDWSPESNCSQCSFCSIPLDKSSDQAPAATSPLSSPSDYSPCQAPTISESSQSAHKFLQAVFHKKDVALDCDSNIPQIAQELMKKMIHKFAMEYASKCRLHASTNGVTRTSSPLSEASDAPLDLTVNRTQEEKVIEPEPDGVLDLSNRNSACSATSSSSTNHRGSGSLLPSFKEDLGSQQQQGPKIQSSALGAVLSSLCPAHRSLIYQILKLAHHEPERFRKESYTVLCSKKVHCTSCQSLVASSPQLCQCHLSCAPSSSLRCSSCIWCEKHNLHSCPCCLNHNCLIQVKKTTDGGEGDGDLNREQSPSPPPLSPIPSDISKKTDENPPSLFHQEEDTDLVVKKKIVIAGRQASDLDAAAEDAQCRISERSQTEQNSSGTLLQDVMNRFSEKLETITPLDKDPTLVSTAIYVSEKEQPLSPSTSQNLPFRSDAHVTEIITTVLRTSSPSDYSLSELFSRHDKEPKSPITRSRHRQKVLATIATPVDDAATRRLGIKIKRDLATLSPAKKTRLKDKNNLFTSDTSSNPNVIKELSKTETEVGVEHVGHHQLGEGIVNMPSEKSDRDEVKALQTVIITDNVQIIKAEDREQEVSSEETELTLSGTQIHTLELQSKYGKQSSIDSLQKQVTTVTASSAKQCGGPCREGDESCISANDKSHEESPSTESSDTKSRPGKGKDSHCPIKEKRTNPRGPEADHFKGSRRLRRNIVPPPRFSSYVTEPRLFFAACFSKHNSNHKAQKDKALTSSTKHASSKDPDAKDANIESRNEICPFSCADTGRLAFQSAQKGRELSHTEVKCQSQVSPQMVTAKDKSPKKHSSGNRNNGSDSAAPLLGRLRSSSSSSKRLQDSSKFDVPVKSDTCVESPKNSQVQYTSPIKLMFVSPVKDKEGVKYSLKSAGSGSGSQTEHFDPCEESSWSGTPQKHTSQSSKAATSQVKPVVSPLKSSTSHTKSSCSPSKSSPSPTKSGSSTRKSASSPAKSGSSPPKSASASSPSKCGSSTPKSASASSPAKSGSSTPKSASASSPVKSGSSTPKSASASSPAKSGSSTPKSASASSPAKSGSSTPKSASASSPAKSGSSTPKSASSPAKSPYSPSKSGSSARKSPYSPSKSSSSPSKSVSSTRKSPYSPSKSASSPSRSVSSPAKSGSSAPKCASSPTKSGSSSPKFASSPRKSASLPRSPSSSPKNGSRGSDESTPTKRVAGADSQVLPGNLPCFHETTPPKRRPGRPKKLGPQMEQKVKRPIGRPRKQKTLDSETGVKTVNGKCHLAPKIEENIHKNLKITVVYGRSRRNKRMVSEGFDQLQTEFNDAWQAVSLLHNSKTSSGSIKAASEELDIVSPAKRPAPQSGSNIKSQKQDDSVPSRKPGRPAKVKISGISVTVTTVSPRQRKIQINKDSRQSSETQAHKKVLLQEFKSAKEPWTISQHLTSKRGQKEEENEIVDGSKDELSNQPVVRHSKRVRKPSIHFLHAVATSTSYSRSNALVRRSKQLLLNKANNERRQEEQQSSVETTGDKRKSCGPRKKSISPDLNRVAGVSVDSIFTPRETLRWWAASAEEKTMNQELARRIRVISDTWVSDAVESQEKEYPIDSKPDTKDNSLFTMNSNHSSVVRTLFDCLPNKPRSCSMQQICSWFMQTTETQSLAIVKKASSRNHYERMHFPRSGNIKSVCHSPQAERLRKHIKKFAKMVPKTPLQHEKAQRQLRKRNKAALSTHRRQLFTLSTARKRTQGGQLLRDKALNRYQAILVRARKRFLTQKERDWWQKTDRDMKNMKPATSCTNEHVVTRLQSKRKVLRTFTKDRLSARLENGSAASSVSQTREPVDEHKEQNLCSKAWGPETLKECRVFLRKINSPDNESAEEESDSCTVTLEGSPSAYLFAGRDRQVVKAVKTERQRSINRRTASRELAGSAPKSIQEQETKPAGRQKRKLKSPGVVSTEPPQPPPAKILRQSRMKGLTGPRWCDFVFGS